MPTDWFYDSEQRIIGYVGLVNIGILTMVSIYKTVEFRYRSVLGKAAFTKKLIFHILLILTTLTDLPMYVEFIIANKYSLVSYSFHKLETAFLFTALSITIADWGHVLCKYHHLCFQNVIIDDPCLFPYLFHCTLPFDR